MLTPTTPAVIVALATSEVVLRFPTSEVVLRLPGSSLRSQGRARHRAASIGRGRPAPVVILKRTLEEAGLPADGILRASYFQLPR